MGWGGITLMGGAAYIRGPVAQGTAVSTKREEGAWGGRPKGAGPDHRSPHPLPCCGTGRKECHVFLFPINFPPPAAFCILETRSQNGHRGKLGLLAGTPLVAGLGARRWPSGPWEGDPLTPARTPWPFHSLRAGGVRRPHIPREGWEGPGGLWEGSQQWGAGRVQACPLWALLMLPHSKKPISTFRKHSPSRSVCFLMPIFSSPPPHPPPGIVIT